MKVIDEQLMNNSAENAKPTKSIYLAGGCFGVLNIFSSR